MPLAGDLQDFALTDVFQLIQLGQKDGGLRIQSAGDMGMVYFKNGIVVHAKTNAFKGEPAIDAILSWKKGRFVFNPGEETIEHTVDLPIQQAILEAARRIDELYQIQKLIPTFDVVVRIVEVPETNVDKIQLNPKEWKVLSFVDGNLSIKEIAQRVYISEFDAAKIFYGMISSGLVKLVKKPLQEKEVKKEPERIIVEEKKESWFSRIFKKK